jgi:hypothetical protein
LSINIIKFYVYLCLSWFSIVFYCVNIKYFPIIDNEKILYPFHELLKVFACIEPGNVDSEARQELLINYRLSKHPAPVFFFDSIFVRLGVQNPVALLDYVTCLFVRFSPVCPNSSVFYPHSLAAIVAKRVLHED